jgi:hypothetical protein
MANYTLEIGDASGKKFKVSIQTRIVTTTTVEGIKLCNAQIPRDKLKLDTLMSTSLIVCRFAFLKEKSFGLPEHLVVCAVCDELSEKTLEFAKSSLDYVFSDPTILNKLLVAMGVDVGGQVVAILPYHEQQPIQQPAQQREEQVRVMYPQRVYPPYPRPYPYGPYESVADAAFTVLTAPLYPLAMLAAAPAYMAQRDAEIAYMANAENAAHRRRRTKRKLVATRTTTPVASTSSSAQKKEEEEEKDEDKTGQPLVGGGPGGGHGGPGGGHGGMGWIRLWSTLVEAPPISIWISVHWSKSRKPHGKCAT